MSDGPGLFVVLEGADGCGKSTQAARLVAALRAAGREALHVRDPGSTPLAEAVRRILLDPDTGHVSVRAETLLYMAARAQLAEEVVVPALRRGALVVCERWTLSTEVYQGLAGGLGLRTVRRLADVAEGAAAPDLVLVLDVPEGVGLGRLAGAPDRMEAKDPAFHREVVRGYRRLSRRRRGYTLLPCGAPDDVAGAVRAAVDAAWGRDGR